MLGIEDEISVFLQALLAGSTVLFVYYSIRVIRRLIKHNLFFISIEDFFFWLGTGLYLFVEIYQTSDGSIRWFFVVGAAAGVLLSHRILALAENLWRRIWRKEEKSIDKSKKTR